MKCNNCSTLFKMINVLNENIASILTGYKLILNVLNNHENIISKLLSSTNTTVGQSGLNMNLQNESLVCNNVHKNIVPIMQSSPIDVAANIDIESVSNLEVEGHLTLSDKDANLVDDKTLDVPLPDRVYPISELMSDVSSIDCSSSSAVPDSDSDSSSDSVSDSYDTLSDSNYLLDSISKPDTQVEDVSVDYPTQCNINELPYDIHDSQLFNLFEVSKLDDSTTFTHFFSNRYAAYYGTFSYCYGNNTFHEARDFSENPYLQKVLNYVEIVYPHLKFNSAMIHKYNSGESFIPQHSDNEQDIVEGSLIATISLGETRTFRFQEVGASKCCDVLKLYHGDSLIMSQNSQMYFTHGIPKENVTGKRLSITLRLLKPKELSTKQKETETQATCLEGPSNSSDLKSTNKQAVLQVHENDYQLPQKKCVPPHNEVSSELNNAQNSNFLNDGYQESQRPFFQGSSYSYQRESGQKFMNARYTSTFTENEKYKTTSVHTNQDIETLYISSSMFRYLDPVKLSTPKQRAQVLFYPGADASQMLQRLLRDPEFIAMEKNKVKKVFVMVGTNNIDRIFDGSCPFQKAEVDINDILYRVWTSFENAQIHVINLLPRQNPAKNTIVKDLNFSTERLCKAHGLTFINTEATERHSFAYPDGMRKNELFSGGYDNVHLNEHGYIVLARYLKYLAHIY